jgi:hypothetical protein
MLFKYTACIFLYTPEAAAYLGDSTIVPSVP